MRVGFMSQVSPDGQYVVTTVNGRRAGHREQLLRGQFQGLPLPPGVLSDPRDSGLVQPGHRPQQHLPGADDPRYVQTDARLESRTANTWSLPGRKRRTPYPEGRRWPSTPTIRTRPQIQYDLYRIPFNDGKGGAAGAASPALAERHEQHLPQGFARRPLDRVRPVPQRPVDASRQPALHRAGGRRRGAAHALQHTR